MKPVDRARAARHAQTGRVPKNVTPQTPVSLWSRELREQRKAYWRHFVRNDEAYHGGDLDRPGYVRTRAMRRLSAERVWDRFRRQSNEQTKIPVRAGGGV
jgi:hypothetical protein